MLTKKKESTKDEKVEVNRSNRSYSDDPAFVSHHEMCCEFLRKAGIPEDLKTTK